MDLREIQISPCGTHHIYQGKPLYKERFDSVLYFREGFAAVQKGKEAWHIHPDGKPAYSKRYLRTFNFYEGRAAVVAKDGWHHILPNGEALYKERYKWVGNFCSHHAVVQDQEGKYFHIRLDGEKAYPQRWKYAGDYRHGITVVQGEEGLSTHIDEEGNFVHGKWFLDLDVYHKGFARAKDKGGWTHIDRKGTPIYRRRFAMVEPFYNGRARVERFDGALEIIDEQGNTVHLLRPPTKQIFYELSDNIVGYWSSFAIATAVELGVLEELPATTEEVAKKRKLDTEKTERFLAALASLNLVEKRKHNWHLTEKGKFLQWNHPFSLAPSALIMGKAMQKLWEDLPRALQKESGWTPPRLFSFWREWEKGASLGHQMITNYARHDYQNIAPHLPLSKARHVLDIGGGTGVLAKYIAEEYPHLQVTVLDLKEAVEQGKNLLPEHLRQRVHFVEGDFFKPWSLQGDCVILARILHDWDDEHCLLILQKAYQALPKGGKVLILEYLLPEEGYAGCLQDLHLLVCLGGKERRGSEYAFLLRQSGFQVEDIRPLPCISSLVIGVKQ